MRLKFFAGCLLSILLVGVLPGQAGPGTPNVGDPWPGIELTVPERAEDRAYLGLETAETFTVDQVRAELVIVQIFSMYCPHCQREAPEVNRLYQRLMTDAALKGRVKLIGIGAGNSQYEVNFFRKTFNIPFPLFADGKFKIHDRLGQVRTPYFFGIAPTGTQAKVVHTHLGNVKELKPFIDAFAAARPVGQKE